MAELRWRRIGLLLVAFVAAAALGAPCLGEDLSPEEALRRYLSAIQDQRFDAAYELVSKAMKTDRKTGLVKPKEVWVKESQYIFAFSEVKIFDFKVGKAQLEGDEAVVPNLLSSQDKFLNQLGIDEYELYTLIKEDGGWKIDRQKEVIEAAEIAKWFPKQPP